MSDGFDPGWDWFLRDGPGTVRERQDALGRLTRQLLEGAAGVSDETPGLCACTTMGELAIYADYMRFRTEDGWPMPAIPLHILKPVRIPA